MTDHLTPEELIDVVEAGTARADRAAHLAACPDCEEQLRELAQLLAVAGPGGDVPEPSPLFWDHLSARVRDAVAREPIALPWWRPYWRPLVALAGGAGIVLVALLLRPAPRPAAAPDRAPIATTARERVDDPDMRELNDMWELLADAAPSMPVDEVSRAGLMPSARATDDAIASLSASERAELVKLLRVELGSTE